MIFSSTIFIFVFLPVFFCVYYAVSYASKSYVIVAGSYVFYAWWSVDFAGLMLLVTVVNYA
ncbi:MAG: membrane-bound O-acyltransferase family protein, partial [Pseudomonadota bacterium]